MTVGKRSLVSLPYVTVLYRIVSYGNLRLRVEKANVLYYLSDKKSVEKEERKERRGVEREDRG